MTPGRGQEFDESEAEPEVVFQPMQWSNARRIPARIEGREPERIASFALADMRREITLIRQELLRIPENCWEDAKVEFHVRLANIEGQIQEEVYAHIEQLLANGSSARAELMQREVGKIYNMVTECQNWINSANSPAWVLNQQRRAKQVAAELGRVGSRGPGVRFAEPRATKDERPQNGALCGRGGAKRSTEEQGSMHVIRPGAGVRGEKDVEREQVLRLVREQARGSHRGTATAAATPTPRVRQFPKEHIELPTNTKTRDLNRRAPGPQESSRNPWISFQGAEAGRDPLLGRTRAPSSHTMHCPPYKVTQGGVGPDPYTGFTGVPSFSGSGVSNSDSSARHGYGVRGSQAQGNYRSGTMYPDSHKHLQYGMPGKATVRASAPLGLAQSQDSTRSAGAYHRSNDGLPNQVGLAELENGWGGRPPLNGQARHSVNPNFNQGVGNRQVDGPGGGGAQFNDGFPYHGAWRPGGALQVPHYARSEGENFYHRLPPPWNVLPMVGSGSQADYMKTLFGHSFSGKLEEYETFRALFIPIKHAVDVPIALKHYSLASSLKGNAQDLVQGTLPTPEGYALLISRLEEAYGGTFRQLDRGMDRIRRLKEVKPGHCLELEALVRAVDSYAASLGPRGHELYVHGNFVAIEEKISLEMRKEYRVWCSIMRRDGDDLDNLMDWLRNVQLPPLRREKDRELVKQSGNRPHRANLSSATKDCPICVDPQKHDLVHCSVFGQMSVDKRRNLISLLKRCFKCLAAEHISRDCSSDLRCRICDRNHHELLHTEFVKTTGNRNNLVVEFDTDDPSSENGDEATFFRAKPTMVAKPEATDSCEYSLRFSAAKVSSLDGGTSLEANILCDDGSNITLIDEEMAQELGLKGERIQTKITGVGGKVEVYSAMYTEVELTSLSGKVKRQVKAKVIPNPTGNLYATNWQELKVSWPHLRSIPFTSPVGSGKCRMILGTDQAYLLRSLEEVPGSTSYEPIARRTPLGWTCVGPMAPPVLMPERTFLSFRASAITEEPELLDRAVGQPSLCCPADRRALRMIVEGSVRVGDRVQVPVLWKDSGLRPENNFFQANNRWRSLQSCLKKSPEKMEQYHKVIQGWQEKGYVRPVPEQAIGKQRAYFLPHFPVCRDDKPSTKLRVVMDGKSEFRGVSLNKCVLPGPKVINSLFDVLVRFRRYPVAIVGDAKEMFLRLLLPPSDRDYHRFVYTPPGAETPVEYENLSHVFGNCGSLTNAVATVKLQALQDEHCHPLAAEVVLRGSMVDDNLASVMTISEAKKVVEGLKVIYANAGMTIHKWSSSHEGALEGIDSEDLANTVDLRNLSEEGDGSIHKALGIVWSTAEDSFSYCYEALSIDSPTQRNLLKHYMSVFDPLGWVCPFIIVARLLYRDTCALKLGWDTVIPQDLERRWKKWFNQLPELSKVSIPRWSGKTRGEVGTLHVFSDASHNAYGACAYWVQGPQDRVSSRHLVAARAKVNSSEARSIPQLELMGAMIGLDLAKSLCRALDASLESVFFWVDAENTLRRVLTPSQGLDRFVARRVAILREETNLQNWRWVDSSRNPADVLSRGTSVIELVHHEIWWHGPDFLEDVSFWPEMKFHPDPHVELEEEADLLRLIGIFHAQSQGCDPWDRHSKFSKCVSVMVLVLRFANRLAKKELFSPTRKGAQLALFKWLQGRAYGYEIGLLEQGKELPAKHPLRAFDVSLEEGLVRIQTRTDLPSLLMLPNKQHLTRLWLRYLHELVLCHVGGHRSLLSEARKTSWIVHGIAECKKVIWECVPCQRRDARPLAQKMAPLPAFRNSPKDGLPYAFASAGLDVAGPFLTKAGRGRAKNKRYLLLICCTVFRAVHHEILYGLETSDILLALQRFSSRRGVPLELISDNATYFRRAAMEIADGSVFHGQGVTSRWQEVEWKFNPPCAPHTGGIFESLIKCAKRALGAVLGPGDLWDDELASAFVFVEGIMNDRPVDFISTDTGDLEPLTPAHFLSGPRVQEEAFQELERGTRFSRRWRHLNLVREQYWKRFLREVKPAMGLRNKWRKALPPLVVGDVVVALVEKNENGRWPLGLVTECYPGPDGLVRVVKVRIQGKEFRRHVNTLMPLVRC
jgi:hypothetical protein